MLEIPAIERPSCTVIPDSVVPFSERGQATASNAAVCFYEMDRKFSELLTGADKYVDELRHFQAVISPDFSMHRDAPLAEQIHSLYISRAIGSYWQRRGLYVIPNIRWGSEDTYTASVLPERVAFAGIEKHSIVAVGSYGCIKHREDRYHFQAGFAAMMETLEPETVLVYGAMPESIFGAYQMYTKLVHYDNWIKTRHERRAD